MEFIKKTVTLHGGRQYYMLTPKEVNRKFAISDARGEYYVTANGSGYEYLSKLFRISTAFHTNEFIYAPIDLLYNRERELWFSPTDYKGIVIMDCYSTHIGSNDLKKIIEAPLVDYNDVDIPLPELTPDFNNHWEYKNILTVKKAKALLVISAKRKVLMRMADSCDEFIDYGDDPKYLYAHSHHDMKENTAKSLGLIFYFLPMDK